MGNRTETGLIVEEGVQPERFLGYAMIIGAMKSGTTTLHYILGQHPQIVTGIRKELDFFRRQRSRWRTPEAYERMFPRLDKKVHAYTLDSSPNYTKSGMWDFAPPRIAALPGRKRLAYVLRDPIDRIDSHIAHNIAEGRWTAEKWPVEHVVATSAYAKQLAKFEEAGLLDDMLLVDFAELSTDPTRVAYDVHDFLGIPKVRPTSLEVKNPRKIDDARVLREEQVPMLKELLREDVETLITRYGFEAAKSWSLD